MKFIACTVAQTRDFRISSQIRRGMIELYLGACAKFMESILGLAPVNDTVPSDVERQSDF